ncbi:zinc finger domain-containing protein [Kitasatospora indigofera]|uniref:zinc finger domain-containing protein n=1 Tax=Kitasatospora indigofera TaxID=67307 RepID=UPI0036BDA61C
MTPEQTDQILALLASANVLNKLEETSPEVWSAALRDTWYPDAIDAAAHLIRTKQWVKIADILETIRITRANRDRDTQGPGLAAEVPDADPDDVDAYLAAIRGQRTRAAIGQPLRPRPVEALLAGVGQLPGDQEAVATVRRAGPLGVECPNCKAPIGRPCKDPLRGKPRATAHIARQQARSAA